MRRSLALRSLMSLKKQTKLTRVAFLVAHRGDADPGWIELAEAAHEKRREAR